MPSSLSTNPLLPSSSFTLLHSSNNDLQSRETSSIDLAQANYLMGLLVCTRMNSSSGNVGIVRIMFMFYGGFIDDELSFIFGFVVYFEFILTVISPGITIKDSKQNKYFYQIDKLLIKLVAENKIKIYYSIKPIHIIIAYQVYQIQQQRMAKTVRIKIGKCYISRSLMPGQSDLYATIRSGLKKVKTRTLDGPNPSFDQTFSLEISNPVLIVKVKDVGGASCLGSCSPFNTVLAQTQIDIGSTITNNETVSGFYSLKYDGDHPAGKIHLQISLIHKN